MIKGGANGLLHPICIAFAAHKFKKCTQQIQRNFGVVQATDIDSFLGNYDANNKPRVRVEFPKQARLSPRSRLRNMPPINKDTLRMSRKIFDTSEFQDADIAAAEEYTKKSEIKRSSGFLDSGGQMNDATDYQNDNNFFGNVCANYQNVSNSQQLPTEEFEADLADLIGEYNQEKNQDDLIDNCPEKTLENVEAAAQFGFDYYGRNAKRAAAEKGEASAAEQSDAAVGDKEWLRGPGKAAAKAENGETAKAAGAAVTAGRDHLGPLFESAEIEDDAGAAAEKEQRPNPLKQHLKEQLEARRQRVAQVAATMAAWALDGEEPRLIRKTQKTDQDKEETKEKGEPRPPIICVLGHVDHGKTTLIDSLRQSSVALSEAGGITQKIGAFSIETAAVPALTLIDTPGHTAFESMRRRGARLIDAAILVVAGTEGVMPTTKECIRILRQRRTRFVVALNKCDLPGFDAAKAKRELAELEVYAEEEGGENTLIEISAKTGENLDEMLSLVYYEALLDEPMCDNEGPAEGIILESRSKEGSGVEVNCIVTNGKLELKNWIVIDDTYGPVKQIVDQNGRFVESAKPSQPVTIVGLKQLPLRAKYFMTVDDEETAKEVTRIVSLEKEKVAKPKEAPKSKEGIVEKEAEEAVVKKQVVFVIKADTAGSVEIIESIIKKIVIPGNEVTAHVPRCQAGPITKGDVLLAQAVGAHVLGFNTDTTPDASAQANSFGLRLNRFDVIYDLSDFLCVLPFFLPFSRLFSFFSVFFCIFSSFFFVFFRVHFRLFLHFFVFNRLFLMAPETVDSVVAEAVIKQTFASFSQTADGRRKRRAGCEVASGELTLGRGLGFKVLRDGAELYRDERGVAELRRGKEPAARVARGELCGVDLRDCDVHRAGDVVQLFRAERKRGRVRVASD